MPPAIRDTSPVAILVDPKNDVPASERDMRLEDWLNDKIQASSDLDDLASLIESVELQKQQLDQQLKDAREKLEATKKDSANHARQLLNQTEQFEKEHAAIQNRLIIINSSDSPEEATERLKGPMEKLRRVELATMYAELLKEVEELTVEARKHLPGNPKEALIPYTRLKELANLLRQLQEPAEGAAVHLVQYVEDTSTSLWLQMKKIMSDEFEAVLKKDNWPADAREPTREWIDCFDRLLDLQGPEITTAKAPLILLPMAVLAKPFVQEFKYHFFSDKPTNSPQRLGDHFFDYFTGIISNWQSFLRTNVAPILAAHFRGNALAGNPLYIDPVSAFIIALLPVLREKVNSLLAKISNDPKLLSKFMKQLLKFDQSIREEFDYDGGNLELGWKGLTWDVLDSWFDDWIGGEKEFAFERYQGIIQSPDSGQIDNDSAAGKTRPTYGATRVVDLINNVIKSYNKIRRFSHKMRFLIEIQAEIFDQYQGRLRESLDAYQSITNPVARTFHGISRERQAELEGIGGIKSLCKVYGSADYIINVLGEWSDVEFFIDLWGDLQSRARSTNVSDNLAGSMSYTDVKNSTSSAVGSEADGGSVFDVTIAGYGELRTRAEDLMIEALKFNLSNSLRHYFSRSQWTTVGEVPSVLNVTAGLDQPLQGLKEYRSYLEKTLSSGQFRHVWRLVIKHAEDLLWNELLLKQDFTTLGAARLSYDLNAIEQVAVDGPDMMSKVRQGVFLLNLPIIAQDDSTIVHNDSAIGLMEVSGAIYATNSKADEVLSKLGLDELSRTDARAILARRVEASE